MDEVSTENTEKYLRALYFCYEKKKGGVEVVSFLDWTFVMRKGGLEVYCTASIIPPICHYITNKVDI